nr:CPBP family intramembrane glutamic endopeptidase [Microlunatus soli]
MRAEVLIVLGLSLGQSAIYSILSIADRLTQQKALNEQSSSLNSSVTPDRPWLDLSYQVVNIAFPLVPVLLALYLLWLHNPAGIRRPGQVIGFDLRRPGFDLGLGTLTALCIGIPGLGLYLGARALGLNTQVQASGLGDNWWTVPVLILSAAENAVVEEVIMLGFLYTRLRQLTWRGQQLVWPVIIIVSALVRGSYHLYQGFGGFTGNLIMGVIFGLIYLKWKRVMPLVIAHTLLDIAAFVGYALLAPHVSWL